MSNHLETMKAWLATYPHYADIQNFCVDYIDRIPSSGGLFPSGLVELERKTDIFGGVTVKNQLNFALYCVFDKPVHDDTASVENAEWLMDFQSWVQEQSCTHAVPQFGDILKKEYVTAQNAMLYEPNADGVGVYLVQLSATFYKIYQEANPWLT